MKKLLFVVNPMAGKSAYKTNLGEALLNLHNAGYEPTLRFTAGRGDATEIAGGSAGYDLLCCLGGDGTLSEVMAGLMRLDKGERPPIGYIPLGTANDVATTLNLPKNNILAAVERIVNGNIIDFDVGECGDGAHFTYVAAFGAFTDVSYETPQQEKQTLGHLAYVLEGISRLPKLTSYRAKVVYDGGEAEDDFLFGGVVNSTSVAGMVHLKSDQIRLDDGLFELVLVRKPRTARELAQTMTGLREHRYDGPCFQLLPTSQAVFTFDQPVAWTRDGEDGGQYREILCRNLCRAVQMIV